MIARSDFRLTRAGSLTLCHPVLTYWLAYSLRHPHKPSTNIQRSPSARFISWVVPL